MEVFRAAAVVAAALLEPMATEIMVQTAPRAALHLAVPLRLEVLSEAPEVTPASNRIALLPPMVRLREQAAAEHSGAAPLCSRRLGIAVQVRLAKSSYVLRQKQ